VVVVLGLGLYADFGSLGDELASFRWELFPLALALTALNYLLRFWRWERYLGEARIEVPRGAASRSSSPADDDDHAGEARRAAQVRLLQPWLRRAGAAFGPGRVRRARDRRDRGGRARGRRRGRHPELAAAARRSGRGRRRVAVVHSPLLERWSRLGEAPAPPVRCSVPGCSSR
jgi:hypothetical protein